MDTTRVTANSTSVAPSSPPRLREVEMQRLHLLHCFALADLLELTPSVRQQMAVAAASSQHAPSSSTATKGTSKQVFPDTVEDVMVSAIVEQLKTAPTTSTHATKTLANSVTMPVPASCREAPPPAYQTAQSVLEASPWTWSTAANLPSSSTNASSPLLLPAVLSTNRGITRVEALHPTFILRVLTAFLHAGCCSEDNTVPLDQRKCCQSAFLQLLQLYSAHLLARQRNVCAAVNELFELVFQGGTYAASENNACRHNEKITAWLQRSFLLERPTQKWVNAFLHFIASIVDILAAQSRRAAHHDTRSGEAENSTAAATSRRTTPIKAFKGDDSSNSTEARQGSQSPTQSPVEVESTEAVWLLQSVGMVLSLMGVDSTQETMVVDVASADAEELKKEILTAEPMESIDTHLAERTTTEGASFGTYRCNSSAEAIAFAVVISRVGQRIVLHEGPRGAQPLAVNAKVQADNVNALKLFLRTLSAGQSGEHGGTAIVHQHCEAADNNSNAHCSSTCVSALINRQFIEEAKLFSTHLEEQQKQQHRLLAAAERAVQRVLRLPSMPWHSPAMLVAMCSVTSYQLMVQQQQLRQRLLDLVAELHEETSCCTQSLPPSALADTSKHVKVMEASSPMQQDNKSLPTAAFAGFGEVLWTDSEENEEGNAEQPQAATARDPEVFAQPSTTSDMMPPFFSKPPAVDSSLPISSSSTVEEDRSQEVNVCSPQQQPLPQLRLYTPRTSLLSWSAQPNNPGDTGEKADYHATDLLASLNDPVRYFSATRSMEHLWELPSRVPLAWTPPLATVMACCALCLPPTSTVVSRLCLLTGEPLLTDDAGNGDARLSAVTIPSLTHTRTCTSPWPSLLDVGSARRREAAAIAETSGTADNSGSVYNSNNVPLGNERGSSSVTVPNAAAANSATSHDGAAIGALTQWHLRSLIHQLCAPPDGIEICTPGSLHDFKNATADATAAAAAGRVNVWSSSMLPSVLATAIGMPSSAGAVSDSSWFAKYTQPNKRATTRITETTRDGSPESATAAGGATAAATTTAPGRPSQHDNKAQSSTLSAVLWRVNIVAILASCFALQHLLRSHHFFFLNAQLGGVALRELRTGVAGARRFAGGPDGWVAGMLQCPPSLNTPLSAGRGTAGSGSGGMIDSEALPAQKLRGRSLWGDVCLTGQGGDRCATALLDAGAAVYHNEVDGASTSSALLNEKTHYGYAMTTTNSNTATEESEDDFLRVAGTCMLTEAVLVAVSFLGSRVVAMALPHLQASLVSSLAASSVAGPSPSHAAGSESSDIHVSKAQCEWCDVLEALAALLLDTHRVHRGRHNTLREQQHANGKSSSARTTEAQVFRERTSASPGVVARRDTSASSAREGSSTGSPGFFYSRESGLANSYVKPPERSFSPRVTRAPTTQPPSLSIEAQFGIGTFFLSLVRALLQLGTVIGENVQDLHASPPVTTAAERVIAQCVFALASVIDDLLHDYTCRPLAALCDVLAMMCIIQIPCQSAPHEMKTVDEREEERREATTEQRSHTLWEALRSTPHWDATRLGALESASYAWIIPSGSLTKSTQPTVSATVGVRRCPPGSVYSAVSPPARSFAPPRDSLLGYMPCSRDPAAQSWLPPLTYFRNYENVESRKVLNLLELMAEEEALILADRSPTSQKANSCSNSQSLPSIHPDNSKEEEKQQLAIAIVSSRRYAWWMSRLQRAWGGALIQSAFSP